MRCDRLVFLHNSSSLPGKNKGNDVVTNGLVQSVETADTAHVAEMLRINTDVARTVIVRFIHDAVHKVNFEKVVLALSGGIDSALVAFLAVEALGKANVLGVRMPYKSSSESSLTDAQQVIDILGIASL